jgi:hypothetical protein
VLGVRDLLALGGYADEALTTLREGHHGRSRTPALAVGDHRRLPTLEHCHARVRGTEVDPDRLSHSNTSTAFYELIEEI